MLSKRRGIDRTKEHFPNAHSNYFRPLIYTTYVSNNEVPTDIDIYFKEMCTDIELTASNRAQPAGGLTEEGTTALACWTALN